MDRFRALQQNVPGKNSLGQNFAAASDNFTPKRNVCKSKHQSVAFSKIKGVPFSKYTLMNSNIILE